jgi:predicted GIY-YIG superfamily endonuclease
MVLGPLAVTLAAFPVNLIQETKKFAKTEKLYLDSILKKIENSVSPFFFFNLKKKNCFPFWKTFGFFFKTKQQRNSERISLPVRAARRIREIRRLKLFCMSVLNFKILIYLTFIYLTFIYFYLMCVDNKSSQSQDESQLKLDKYNEINIMKLIFFLFTANPPSIYQITCNVNGKIYIGEAKNLLDQINQHYKTLENGLADCYELQRDLQSYGKDCFTMKRTRLVKGEAFLTREKRLEKENQIINLYKPEQVYNPPTPASTINYHGR